MHSAMHQASLEDNPDADFARLMVSHHQGAIDMAKVELRYGTDPRLRRLAQEIIVTQQSEIELMQMALVDYSLSPAAAAKPRAWCSQR